MYFTGAIFFLWVFASFGTWENPEGTVYPPSQIGLIKYVSVGKLNCAGRLNDIAHFQAWCIKDSKVVFNQLTDFGTNGVITVAYGDNKPNEISAGITWMLAYIEGNPQTVGYQIGLTVDNTDRPYISGRF